MDGKVGTAPPHRWGGRWGLLAIDASRQEAEFFAAPNRCSAAVHTELGVNALRVGADGAQPDDQLVRDAGAIEVGGEKPKDVKLPLAERLDQALVRSVATVAASGSPPADVARTPARCHVWRRPPSMRPSGAPSATNTRTYPSGSARFKRAAKRLESRPRPCCGRGEPMPAGRGSRRRSATAYPLRPPPTSARGARSLLGSGAGHGSWRPRPEAPWRG